jgi:MOSC domain-containing protein YiiM
MVRAASTRAGALRRPVLIPYDAPMRTIDELEAALAVGPPAPRDAGPVRLHCVRKGDGIHETPDAVEITARDGLRGDRWANRRPGSDPDGATAVTLMNANVAALVAHDTQPLHAAGDNLLVDLDIGVDALPAGSQLAIGNAILRVSEQPHTGCATFSGKFGLDALKWVSTPEGRHRRLRGVNCSVERPGTVRVGDTIRVITRPRARQIEPDETGAFA